MVIIKKPTAKRLRQSGKSKFFKRVLSVVLSVTIIASAFAIGIPMVSARGGSSFQNNEEIFIDCRLDDNTYWDTDGASFKVFTFYSNSSETDYCHEYAGNFNNDGWYEGSNVLSAGITADKFSDHIYRFRIPTEGLDQLRVVRTNSSGTQRWNLTPHMWNNQRNMTNGNKNNCIHIKSWGGTDNISPAEWTTFRPANNASYNSKTATPDNSITGNSNLFIIDATFYDYYNDDEIQKGWRNINYDTNHASVHYTQNYASNSWYWWAGYWEPFQYLNSKIAAQAGNDVNYPLYFGNFNGKGDGYTGEGTSNLKKYNYHANNSADLGSYYKSITGLTGGTLDSNGDLVYATNNGYNSTTKIPFFDASFLSSNKVGSVVSTKFPMRKETVNGVTGYYFDSTGGKDNVWFSNLDSTPTFSYANNTKKAKDSLYSYSDREASGYGFFPFDERNSNGTDVDAKNYGFGMRTDIKFNIGMNGKTNGVDEVFSFTGDDDLWVYIDGRLILDLGGAHKKANGTINFATRTVNVTTGAETFNSATRNTSFADYISNTDPTAEHTLTMFYVERGMVESNLSFNFNFSPVGNEYIVDKTVKTKSVNSGLASDVAGADTFTFTQPTANGKVSSKGTITNNRFTLTDGESISFKDQFTVPTSMTVTESESSPLEYTTSWKAVDLVLKGKGESASNYTIAQSSGNSKQADFTYKTLDTSSEFAMTRVQLSYENTPTVAPVYITKTVTGLNGETDATEFNGTVQISLDNGSTWLTRQLAYTASGVSGTKYLTSGGKLASGARLRNGRTLTFAGIPQGALVRFVEDTPSAGYVYVSATVSGKTVTTSGNGGYFKVTSSNNTMTVTNNRQSGSGSLTFCKTLNGVNYTGDLFTFKMAPITASGYVTGGAPADVTSVNDGEVAFDLSFSQPGKYRYSVSEQRITDELAQQGYGGDGASGKTYYVQFEVADSGSGLEIVTTSTNHPRYYSDSSFTTEIGEITFVNTFKNDLTVKKIVEGYDDLNNSDIADALCEDETFAYSIGTGDFNNFAFANNVPYTHTDYAGDTSSGNTGALGTFDLQDQESAAFIKQFDTGEWITVSEDSVKNLFGQQSAVLAERYTTRWDLYDGTAKITDSVEYMENYEANFELVGHKSDAVHTPDPTIPASLLLTYYNKINTGKLVIAKEVLNGDGDNITSSINENFTFTVKLNLYGKTTYTSYPLNYEIGTYNNGVFTKESTAYSANGTITFNPKKAIRIPGLPIGTRYTISETNIPSGYVLDGSNGKTGFIGRIDEQIFTNIQSNGVGEIDITKLLDDEEYTGSQFSFSMSPIQTQSTATKTYRLGEAPADVTTVTDGAAKFTLSFNQVGWYRYSVIENDLSRELTNLGYSGDPNTYYVEFEVIENNGKLQISTTAQGKPRFYSDSAFTDEMLGIAFENNVQPAKIVVTKIDQAGNRVEDTKFAVVKVSEEITPETLPENYIDIINGLIDNNVGLNVGITATQTEGEAAGKAAIIFDNLPIYQNGDNVFDFADNEWSSNVDNYKNGTATPQTYMVFEYSPANGFNTNRTLKFVTFPYEGNYSITFDYTDAAVMMPVSAGSGTTFFLVLGFGIFGTSMLMAAAYCVLVRTGKRKTRKAAHGRRYK